MKSEEWQVLLKRTLLLASSTVLSNQAINILFATTQPDPTFPTDIDKMPNPVVFAAQMVFCMMIEDMTFYFSHRFLHLPGIYSIIHKIHHEH